MVQQHLALCLFAAAVSCVVPPPSWGTAEIQIDSREFVRASLDGQVGLPGAVALWGFIDAHSPGDYFGRVNVSREVAVGMGPLVEIQAAGDLPEVYRGGAFWRLPLPLVDFAQVNVTADDEGSFQVRLIHDHRLCSRFSVGGFADLNLDEEGRNPRYVVEQQVRLDTGEQSQVFAEVKLNEFVPGSAGFGVGLGMRWLF